MRERDITVTRCKGPVPVCTENLSSSVVMVKSAKNGL
jgi:hypothetical protein